MIMELLMVGAMGQSGSAAPASKPVHILTMTDGRILSMGGPLKFDEKGLCIIGECTFKSGGICSYNGVEFKVSPEFWSMESDNRVKFDAIGHIKVENGTVFHDGQAIDLDAIKVKWICHAVFWQDWVVGIGLTSKQQASLYNLEPRELVYYNWKTRKGGSVYLVNKSLPDFRILTK